MTNETWGIVRNELLKTVGKNNFATWIEPLQFSELSEGVAKFLVPTNFFGTWVSRNFADQIRQQLVSAGHDVERIEFAVRNAPLPAVEKTAGSTEAPSRTAAAPASAPVQSAAPAKPAARTAAARSNDDGETMSAPLDTRFTFDSFVVGKPNELAHAAARRVAEGGPVSFNPLFLYGG
ncbi:chromosomal replication initiator protein DnaA, partial [Thioclava sp. BHET1]